MPQQAVIKDIEFLKMITRGHTSAYAINKSMKDQAEVNERFKAISYKNIAERMLRLAKDELIEEAEINDKRSIHGRKDYRLTSKGLMTLFPNTEVISKEDVKTITEYLSKAYGDDNQSAFGQITVFYYLCGGFMNMLDLLEECSKCISQPKLMPLQRALVKDLASFKFKEIFKFSKSESFVKLSKSEPMVKEIIQLAVSRRT